MSNKNKSRVCLVRAILRIRIVARGWGKNSCKSEKALTIGSAGVGREARVSLLQKGANKGRRNPAWGSGIEDQRMSNPVPGLFREGLSAGSG